MTRPGSTSRSMLLILMVALVWPMSLRAQESTPKLTKEQFERMISTYYQKPSPGIITSAMNYMNEERMPKDKSQIPPFLGFFAIVFRDNPQRLLQWQSQYEAFNGNTKQLMEQAMAYSQHPEKLLGADKEKLSPEQNDLCWGAYFASGDDVYLERLVDRLQYVGERKLFLVYVTAATAQWSLASNARHHRSVKEFLEKKVNTTTGPLQTAIKAALEQDPGSFRVEINKIVKEGQANKTWVMPEQPKADAKK